MKIEQGTNYRTNDGRKVVGVKLITHVTRQTKFPFFGEILSAGEPSEHWIFDEDGRAFAHGGYDPNRTIVAEWADPEPATKAIDFSKIRVGDKVRLGGVLEVTNVDHNGSAYPISVRTGPDLCASVFRAWIVEHIPALRSIKVGDRVRVTRSDATFVGAVASPLCRGYVLLDIGTSKPIVVDVSSLARIDEPVA